MRDNANRQIWEDQTLSGLPTRRVNTPVDVDGNRSATTLTGVYGLYYEYTQRQQLSVIQSAAQVNRKIGVSVQILTKESADLMGGWREVFASNFLERFIMSWLGEIANSQFLRMKR